MELVDLKHIIKHALPLNGKNTVKGDQWFYINHIPKTAGTSFLYAIYDYHNSRQIYPNAFDYYVKQKAKYISLNQLKEQQNKFIQNEKIIIGHFRQWPINNLRPTKPKVICFLRNPIDRVMSTIDYHRIKGRRYQGMTREEVISKHLLFESHVQSIYLGFNPTIKNYQHALDNLELTDSICITEQFEKSIHLINKQYKWGLKSHYFKNKRINESWPDTLKTEIKAYCAFELDLYKKAKEKFENDCTKYNL